MSDEKITVLVVEPMKGAYTKEICGLKEMQELIGGYIEAVPLLDTDPVVAVVNEEGKLLGLPYNRPLFGEDGKPYDLICGTFFVAGVGEEHFISLTDRQIQKYKKIYDNVMLISLPKTKEKHQQGKDHHER